MAKTAPEPANSVVVQEQEPLRGGRSSKGDNRHHIGVAPPPEQIDNDDSPTGDRGQEPR